MFLCIDTIGPCAGIALIRERKAYYHPIDPMQASEKLLETIDQALRKLDAEPSELAGVLIIKGPGSFTGLRVGIAIANQFAHQLKIPVAGITTDQWWRCRTGEQDAVYLQTMNRSEVYAVGMGALEQAQPAAVIPTEALAELKYPSSPDHPVKWLGPVSDTHKKSLPDHFEEIASLESVEDAWLKALLSADWKKYEDYQLLEPFYGKEANITVSAKPLL